MPQTPRRRRRLLRRASILAALALGAAFWISWTELQPDAERAVRVELQDLLLHTFPHAMQPAPGYYGVFPAGAPVGMPRSVGVLLVHGLDEPGTIWSDLIPALSAAGFASWELRYPNDQSIDRSADLLADAWSALPNDRPLLLIGHSMGGLVIRDFVTRRYYPTAESQGLNGATVQGVILAGTPNQGSNWARMRFWLEPRDQLSAIREQRFSILSGLKDGTGAAKIDLRPGSRFLQNLNQRPWPATIPLWIIGGQLTPDAPALGDGVVSADSLVLANAPPPIMLAGSHRGMLKRLSASADEPAAIALILELLEAAEKP